MIPFWKKTGKHSKPQSAQKRRQNTKPAVPRTAQQSIPMQRMFEDGTCRVKPNYYTRTIQYQDINYQLAQQEDKTAIFEEWCRDHPCVCGEKTKPVPAGGILMGSPPRVRGKVSAGKILLHDGGITPAYAGKRLHLHTA